LVFSSNEEEIKKYNLDYNDLLFNRTNSADLVGKTAIYKGDLKAIFAGYLIKIKTKKNLDADYLNYLMTSSFVRKQCNEVKTDAVNQSNINAQKLGDFILPIATVKEQHQIVSILGALHQKEQEAKTLLDLEDSIKLLEKSILSKAFRGELCNKT
jgi:type I restriction enzyme S subunit